LPGAYFVFTTILDTGFWFPRPQQIWPLMSWRTFLQGGVLSCYELISADEPIIAKKELCDNDWLELLRLA